MAVYIHFLALFVFSLEIGLKELCSVQVRDTNSIVSDTKLNFNIADRIFKNEKLHFKIDKATLLQKLKWILYQVYENLLDPHFINENNHISGLITKYTNFYTLELSFCN